MSCKFSNTPWTPFEEKRLADLCATGVQAGEAAAVLNRELHGDHPVRTVRSVQNKRTGLGLKVGAPPPPAIERAPEWEQPKIPLDIPPRPFVVPIPAPSRAMPLEGVTRAVVYGDSHFPFQDDACLQIVQGVVKDVKPHVLLHVGDLVDAWQISRFDKDPARMDTLQDNIDAAREHLHQMAALAPKARRVLLEGNHENRLTRAICGMEGVQRELAKLRAFQEAMTWRVLLDLDAIGFEWVPDKIQSKTPILPKLITKHGSIVRKAAGMTARGEWEKYGRSGLSGHTHRLCAWRHRDANGVATWIETGCTCKLEAEYGSDFDWQQGFAVLTWSADHRLLHTECVSVRDGATIYRDTEYVGDAALARAA